MCDAVLDTGATDSIVASSLVSHPNRRGYCAVKVGDGHYTYSEEQKSVDVCMGNFILLVRKSHCHVFLGGLDPGQAPPKNLLLMLRLT